MKHSQNFDQLGKSLIFECPFTHYYVLERIRTAFSSAQDFFTNFDFEASDILPDPKTWSHEDWVHIGDVCDEILTGRM